MVKGDPAGGLRNPKQPKRLPKLLGVDEVVRLLESIPTDTALGVRDRAMFETLYGGGLRVSELVGLDLVRPRPARRAWSGSEARGSRERLAPIGPTAIVLDWAMACRGAEASQGGRAGGLPESARGTRLTTRSVGRLLESII